MHVEYNIAAHVIVQKLQIFAANATYPINQRSITNPSVLDAVIIV